MTTIAFRVIGSITSLKGCHRTETAGSKITHSEELLSPTVTVRDGRKREKLK